MLREKREKKGNRSQGGLLSMKKKNPPKILKCLPRDPVMARLQIHFHGRLCLPSSARRVSVKSSSPSSELDTCHLGPVLNLCPFSTALRLISGILSPPLNSFVSRKIYLSLRYLGLDRAFWFGTNTAGLGPELGQLRKFPLAADLSEDGSSQPRWVLFRSLQIPSGSCPPILWAWSSSFLLIL